ncbi:MAG: hypothetical protein R3F34_10905 [Planctomycetota bacterium]
MRTTRSASLVLATFVALAQVPFTTSLDAQESGYRLPPKEIVDVLDAKPTPSVDFSPDGKRFLLVERPAMPSIAEVAAPWEGLAGMRIDPELFSRRILSFATAISVRTVSDAKPKPLALPEGARIAQWRWSPKGDRIALTLAGEGGLELWIADAESGACRKLASHVNAVLGTPFGFVGDGSTMWVRLVPDGAKAPAPNRVPKGPAIQETSGSSAPLRTIQDLLDDPESEDLFEFLATSRFAWVDVETGTVRKVGEPGMYLETTPSPDGRFVLVQAMQRPFSYVLAYYDFPRRVEVWKASGEVERFVREVPLGDDVPMEGVETGPRNFQWRATAPSTLVWAEAQDGGDPSRPAELRDIWFAHVEGTQAPPFELARLEERARGIEWLGASERSSRASTTATGAGCAPGSTRSVRGTRSRSSSRTAAATTATAIRVGSSRLNEYGESVVYERDGLVLRAGPVTRRRDRVPSSRASRWRRARPRCCGARRRTSTRASSSSCGRTPCGPRSPWRARARPSRRTTSCATRARARRSG